MYTKTSEKCDKGEQHNDGTGVLSAETDERIVKFLELFLSDTTYEKLSEAVNAKNDQEIFKCVHDLKGMALNLGLTALQKAAQNLCDAVRYGEPSVDIDPLYQEVTKEYQKVVDIIHVIMQGQNRSV